MILEASIAAMLAEQEKPPLLPKVERFSDAAAKEFEAVILEIAEAILKRDAQAHERALKKTQAYIGGILVLGNLTGRRSMLIEADRVAAQKVGMMATQGISLAAIPDDIPKVEFRGAIEDLVRREPRLAKGAAEVSRLYANQHAFALARVTDLRVTQRVQQEIVRGLKEGFGVQESSANIARILGGLEDYAGAYAETVFRTNASTAFTAGQMQQAQDPDVAEVVPAFEFSSVGDGDTRPNHQAANGLIAPTDHQIWKTFAPPLGHRCRCDLITLDIYELRRRGLIDESGRVRVRIPPNFSQAKPDPGFGRTGNGLVGV